MGRYSKKNHALNIKLHFWRNTLLNHIFTTLRNIILKKCQSSLSNKCTCLKHIPNCRICYHLNSKECSSLILLNSELNGYMGLPVMHVTLLTSSY